MTRKGKFYRNRQELDSYQKAALTYMKKHDTSFLNNIPKRDHMEVLATILPYLVETWHKGVNSVRIFPSYKWQDYNKQKGSGTPQSYDTMIKVGNKKYLFGFNYEV